MHMMVKGSSGEFKQKTGGFQHRHHLNKTVCENLISFGVLS